MSYRSLTVDGKDYEFTVGRTHTKVKGHALYKNDEIGDRVGTSDRFLVTPHNVANAIKGVKAPRAVMSCSHGTVTHKTTADPFDSEIHGEYTPMIDCPKCVQERSWEI